VRERDPKKKGVRRDEEKGSGASETDKTLKNEAPSQRGSRKGAKLVA